MDCIEFETQIPEYLEKQLPPATRLRIETHLAGCAGCRALARELDHLDVELARSVKAPALPPEFRTRLEQRIQAIPVWSEAERAERKRRLQAEYEAGLARLHYFPLRRRRSLRGLGWVTLVGAIGWLGWWVLPQLGHLFPHLSPTGPNQGFPLALVVSVIFVAMGLAAATFPRQFRQVLLVVR